jgi:hypothetical protein
LRILLVPGTTEVYLYIIGNGLINKAKLLFHASLAGICPDVGIMLTPSELTIRQMTTSNNDFNNASSFPIATEISRFTGVDMIGLLERSLPAT